MGLVRGAKETAKRAKAVARRKKLKTKLKNEKPQKLKTKPAPPIKEVRTRAKKSLRNQKPDKTQKKSENEIVDEYYAREFEKGEAARKAKSGRKPKTITKKQAADLEKDLDKMFKKDSRHPGRKTRRDTAYGDRDKKTPIRGAAARRRAKKK